MKDMKITFEVKKAEVIVSHGTDLICLNIDAPTPYPEMKYPATIHINARHGYGETWCKEVLEITPTVIKI